MASEDGRSDNDEWEPFMVGKYDVHYLSWTPWVGSFNHRRRFVAEECIEKYEEAVDLFGHPDFERYEMSHPEYRPEEGGLHLEENCPLAHQCHLTEVDITIDGYTAMQDYEMICLFARYETCHYCGWPEAHDWLAQSREPYLHAHPVLLGCWCQPDRPPVTPETARTQEQLVADTMERRFESTLCMCRLMLRMKRRAALVRWTFLRRVVRARGVLVFWMGEVAKRACAPGGPGRKADAAAFKAEFV